MPNYSSNTDEDLVEFDPVRAKEMRAQDAEKIRQDFIRSQRLPSDAPASQKPLPKTEDEY